MSPQLYQALSGAFTEEDTDGQSGWPRARPSLMGTSSRKLDLGAAGLPVCWGNRKHTDYFSSENVTQGVG